MALNITAIWEALFDTTPTAAELAAFESEDASSGDAATIASIIASGPVQQDVIPVIQIIQLATGLAPNASQLANWVAAANSEGLLAVAQAWVSNSNFQAQYGATSTSIIEGIYAKAFGIVPTSQQIAAWSVDTPAQILLAFATSTVYTNAIAPYVTKYLADVMDAVSGAPGAVFPSGSLTSLPVTTINQTLELTVGSDTAISGQAFDGTGPTVLSNGVEINAGLSGPFGNQPTLTAGDVINLSGTGNILNATFDGSSILTSVTIEGAQSWNITQAALGFTEVAIEGTSGSLNGLTSLTYSGNGFTPSELTIGSPVAGTGIASAANGFNLTVSNDPGGTVAVFFASSSFVGGDQINATANAGGFPITIKSGSGGAAGFATWNVTSNGANGGTNSIALGALGSKDATTLNVFDDGTGTTVITAAGDPADWANLTTINALGSGGTLTITGGELASGDGLLKDDTAALTLVEGGSGADTFDLSSYTGTTAQVAGLSIFGGGNVGTTVELSNTEINTISTVAANAFEAWNGVPILADVGVGGGSAVGGAFNMADFPGTLTVTLLSDHSATSGENQTTNIAVTNAPDGLNFDFNSTDQNAHNFSVVGSDTAGGAANVVNVNYVSYPSAIDSEGTFSAQNFDFVNIDLTGPVTYPTLIDFYFSGLEAIANADAPETLTINASLTHAGGELVLIGNVTSQVLGGNDITLLGGPIVVNPPNTTFTDTGTLDITGSDAVVIGVTNASTIHSTSTSALLMSAPDDVNSGGGIQWTAQTHDTVSSTSTGSWLQGTLIGTGPADLTPGSGTDVLTDTAGGSQFFGDGGADSIKIGGGGNNVFFGEYVLNINGGPPPLVQDSDQQQVEAGGDANLGFWGATSNGQAIWGASGDIFGTASVGGNSTDVTTITGFTVSGATHDAVTFDVLAWNSGGHFGGGLDDANSLGTIGATSTATAFNVGIAGEHIDTSADVVLNSIPSSYTDAAALATALSTETVGNFNLGTALPHGDIIDILVAYNTGTGVNIADVELQNTNVGGSLTDTAASGMAVHATDLVSITGIALTQLGLNLGDIQFTHV